MNDKNEEYEKIISDIKNGMTGEAQTDVGYLKDMYRKYEKHSDAQRIQGECIRMMFELMTEGEKAEFLKEITPDYSWVNEALNDVVKKIKDGNIDNALEKMEALVNRVEEVDMYKDNDACEYHSFDEPFEEILFRSTAKTKKEIRQAAIPYGQIYRLYGSLLIEKRQLAEAREIFIKGMKWNPVSFAIWSEYIEIYKMLGDMERFFLLTNTAFGIAFHAKDTARCYRNLGYYFIEKKLYSEAVGCYMVSREFEPDAATVYQELDYIEHTAGSVEPPSNELFREYAEKNGFPPHGNPGIQELALTAARQFSRQGQKRIAEYFLSISNELAGDKKNKI